MAGNESVEVTRSYEFCFDDSEVGRMLQMGIYTVTEEEILIFALQYDLQPFHIDAEAVKHSIYGGVISGGWMTCSIMMRLTATGLLGKAASMGSSGVDEIRWMKPMCPGDTSSVLSTRMGVCLSQSKPDHDVAVNRWEARSQRGELVCTVVGMDLFGRRPKA